MAGDLPTDGLVLAALAVLGWPDDRERSAHVEEDGYEVTPAGHYWSIVCDVLTAANLAAELDLRAEVARVRADVAEEVRAFADEVRGNATTPSTGFALAAIVEETANRIVPVSAQCRRGECTSCDFGSIHAPCRHDCHAAVAPAESVVGAPTPDADTPLDRCCDASGLGCGHRIDGHSRGANCTHPGCRCRVWRDHVNCEHRRALPEDEGTRQHHCANCEGVDPQTCPYAAEGVINVQE